MTATTATRLIDAALVTDGDDDNRIYCDTCLEASPELEKIGPVWLIDKFPRLVERAPKLPSCSGCGRAFEAAP